VDAMVANLAALLPDRACQARAGETGATIRNQNGGQRAAELLGA